MTEKKPEVSEGIPRDAAVLVNAVQESKTAKHGEVSRAFRDEKESLQGRSADRNAATVPAPEREDFRIYETTEEDTLWRISKKEYGSGFYFPVIMGCNPGIRIYDIGKGMRLKIFKDTAMAKKLYSENVRIEGGRAYYYYSVLEGDTFGSIALKFYKQGNMKNRIMDLNPHVKLHVGIRIKIELE